ncbi:ATP-dependent Clp protease ATP-binding subunit [Patescibacteria group bacterium]|nr:ATP-dependent Clp protease ATP-binding subunit [Patescibacteria group bacterium]MBU1703056.1 ATP-dependent Clp protease ATP-binding subunit [Patescibacteria group bacterium]MBU1954149.1 ATP-dependent Clp protease ATP-binding subunit [Patescibacteria group bacterium]
MSDNRFEKFTKEAKQALVVAQEKARDSKLNYVGTEHILIGILSQANSLGAAILMNFGVSMENVHLVLKTVGRMSTAPAGAQKGWGGLSGFAKKVIEQAVLSAHEFNHSYIGTEHLLYALVAQENTAATVILENMKVNPSDIRDQIIQAFEKNRETAARQVNSDSQMAGMNPIEFFLSGLHGVLVGNMQNNKEQFKDPSKQKTEQKGGGAPPKTPALDYFTIDVTDQCRKGKLGPVIGRKKEIERIVSILCRKTKNNPVLIGEPGVGKTAVVEGLAHAIVLEQVPDMMLDKRILSLSMTSVVAGTKYRGEFEERIKQIIDEAASQPNVILFIDELHSVIGAGSAEGSLDAANILKPALSRGQVQVIGATTTNEYRKHIESDTALERRFQPVIIGEPSEKETLEILRGLREGFEEHHNLLISEEAMEVSITLSKRYIHDRFLPDKAIDLLDEACSNRRIKSKGNIDKVRKLQKELSKIIKRKEESVSSQDYEHAAELRNRELELLKEIEATKLVKIPREQRENIGQDDIAYVVSTATGIPVTRLVKADIARLKNLGTLLEKRVVGQDEAINAVAKAIQRSRAGFADHKRPIGSFIFMGPTGVGKTELVRALAEEIYNDKDALIKIDMSEFMERHNTSRLVGTTAGYVGYDDGGQLTETVRRKPYSVVLFDEIEKAHPDVFNLLLQILEDGELTDSKGRRIDFKNTIIVMTSNIGAKRMTEGAAPIGFNIDLKEIDKAEQDFERIRDTVLDDLKNHFRPEFLNRIDKVIVFHPLKHEHIREIVKMHIGYLQDRLKKKNITIQLTPGGLETLAKLSYDPHFGARPVRRKVQELVEDELTQKYLDGTFKDNDTIKIVKDGESIRLQRVVPKKKAAGKSASN